VCERLPFLDPHQVEFAGVVNELVALIRSLEDAIDIVIANVTPEFFARTMRLVDLWQRPGAPGRKMTFDMDIEAVDAEELRPPDPDPDGPSRLGAPVWVAVAAVAVVSGFLVLGHGQRSADEVPGPNPTTASAPEPTWPSNLSPWRPGQRQYLGVTRICGPVTDGRRRLAVSFEVSNISGYQVQIQSVVGVLPEGGLRQHGPATLGGNCVTPGSQPLRTAIPGDQSRFYTLTFDLPKTCPARYPILVRIGFAARELPESSLSLLESDLSVPEFATCGAAGTVPKPAKTGPKAVRTGPKPA
jgi:hypothetical protein